MVLSSVHHEFLGGGLPVNIDGFFGVTSIDKLYLYKFGINIINDNTLEVYSKNLILRCLIAGQGTFKIIVNGIEIPFYFSGASSPTGNVKQVDINLNRSDQYQVTLQHLGTSNGFIGIQFLIN